MKSYLPADAILGAHVYLDLQMTEFYEICFMHIAGNHTHSFDQLWFSSCLFLKAEAREMVGLLVLLLTQQVGLDAL